MISGWMDLLYRTEALAMRTTGGGSFQQALIGTWKKDQTWSSGMKIWPSTFSMFMCREAVYDGELYSKVKFDPGSLYSAYGSIRSRSL